MNCSDLTEVKGGLRMLMLVMIAMCVMSMGIMTSFRLLFCDESDHLVIFNVLLNIH
jgi:hypothetical protein